MIWQQILQWSPVVFAGLFCGIFSATLGLGAGVLMVPALLIIFHLPQKSAQGIALAVMVPMALVGAIRYKLNPSIDINMAIVFAMAAGAVVGAYIGSGLVAKIPAGTLQKLFAIVLLIVAVKMLFTKPPQKNAPPANQPDIAQITSENSHSRDTHL